MLPRDAFEDAELLDLLRLPLFTGCASPYRIWTPILARKSRLCLTTTGPRWTRSSRAGSGRSRLCLALARDAGEIGAAADCYASAEFFWIGWEGAVVRRASSRTAYHSTPYRRLRRWSTTSGSAKRRVSENHKRSVSCSKPC